jgi:hypothetical protein
MSGSSRRQVIKVWDYQRAPKNIKRVADDPAAAWVALIPATLAGADIEALFLRWSSDAHPVARHILADGSILFSGTYPTTAMVSNLANRPGFEGSTSHSDTSRSQET